MIRVPSTVQVVFTIILANIFWAGIFGGKYINFWLGMTLAAIILACISIYLGGAPFFLYEISWRSVFLGIISAGVLYSIFYLGNIVAKHMFGFVQKQVQDIYAIQHEGTPLSIFCVLFFITSPAEEIFWRGFLQKWLMLRCGEWQGWIFASGIYGIIHVWSGNIMLTLAALTAGLFWGALYWKSKNLILCMVSHAFWTVVIFVFFPIGLFV